jgi:hypothetical protein
LGKIISASWARYYRYDLARSVESLDLKGKKLKQELSDTAAIHFLDATSPICVIRRQSDQAEGIGAEAGYSAEEDDQAGVAKDHAYILGQKQVKDKRQLICAIRTASRRHRQ